MTIQDATRKVTMTTIIITAGAGVDMDEGAEDRMTIINLYCPYFPV
jgi:hypothetical protein